MTTVQNQLTAERLGEGDQLAVPDSNAVIKLTKVQKKKVEYVVTDPDNPEMTPEKQTLSMDSFLEMMNRPSGTKTPPPKATPKKETPKPQTHKANDSELAKVFNEMCQLVDQKRKKEEDFTKTKKRHNDDLLVFDKKINDCLKIGRDKVIQTSMALE